MADTITTRAMMTESIKSRYYDELFLTVAEKKLVHTQLGQLNRKSPKGENAYATYWTRWKPLAAKTAASAEGVATTAVNMSAVNVTGTVAQYDNAIKISDVLALTNMGDIMKEAIRELGYNAGLSIDTLVRNTVVPGAVIQNAGSSGAATNWSAIPQSAVLTISELRKATRTLRKLDAQPPESRVSMTKGQSISTNPGAGMGGYWVAVISPDSAYDLWLHWRSLAVMLIKKFREFGEYLKKTFETIPSRAFMFIKEGVETMHGTPYCFVGVKI